MNSIIIEIPGEIPIKSHEHHELPHKNHKNPHGFHMFHALNAPGLPWPSRPILVAFGSTPAAPPAAPLVDAQTRRRGARHSATRHTAPWEMPWDAQKRGGWSNWGSLKMGGPKVTVGFKVSILKWSNDLDDFGVPNHEKNIENGSKWWFFTKQNDEFWIFT